MKRIVAVAIASSILLGPSVSRLNAEDKWTEVRSTNFRAWSNTSDRFTRDLLWQLEQIRFALRTLWPWTQVDLAKPMLVFAVRDEQSMKALAPEFWEQRGGVRPGSVWVTGSDQHYMVIRVDQRGEEDRLINPYTSAYFSYVNLILMSSFGRDIPLWFSRGLAGVQSNTIVQGKQILLGPPIPWHIERLQTYGRLKLKDLIGVTRSSREYTQENGLERFDAQAWALVHFLMFGQNAARRQGINKFAEFLDKGAEPEAAFREAFGRPEDLEADFAAYINRRLYSYQQFELNKGIAREQFKSQPLTPAQSAAGRASVHVAMGRPVEARALIDEARKSDANSADAFAAEAQLLLRENKRNEANAAFVKAAKAGTSHAYVYYRAATSMWGATRTDDEVLKQMDEYLTRATELNPFHAESFASLAEVRSALKHTPEEIFSLLAKAVKLDPADPWIRLTAARSLWRVNKLEEARNVARVALNLSGSDARAKAEAERLLATIPEKK